MDHSIPYLALFSYEAGKLREMLRSPESRARVLAVAEASEEYLYLLTHLARELAALVREVRERQEAP